MPTYEIYKRDGTPIRVEGPEGATTQQLINLYRQRTGYTPETEEGGDSERERLLNLREELARYKAPGFFQQAQELPKGIIGGAANLFEQGALGLATLLDEDAELAIREKIQDVGDAVQGWVAPDANIQERMDRGTRGGIPRKFSEALGSFAGILGTAAIPYVGVPAAAGLATAAGAGEASERAREGGATQEERNLATRLGAIVGTSEIISPWRIINRFRKNVGDEVATNILARGRRIAAEAGVEGLQEFGAAVGQNLIEQGIYNPEQGTFEGSGEAFGYGAGVGGFVQAFVEMVTPRRRGGATDPTEEDPTLPQLQEGQEQGELFGPEVDLGQPVGTQGELFGAGVALGTAPKVESDPYFKRLSRMMPQEDTDGQLDLFDDPLEQGVIGKNAQEAIKSNPSILTMSDEEWLSYSPSYFPEGIDYSKLVDAEQKRIKSLVARVGPTKDYKTLGIKNEDEYFEIQKLREKLKTETKKPEEPKEEQLDLFDRPVEPEVKKSKVESEPDLIDTAATTDTAIGDQLSKALAEKQKAEQDKLKQKTTLTDQDLRKLQDDEAAAAQNLDEAFSSIAPTEEVQQSLPGLAPKYGEKTRQARIDTARPDTTEPVTSGPQYKEELIATLAGRDPNVITDGLLDRLGVSAKAPVRKRVVGKDITDPIVRQELAKFGNNPNVSKETKLNISRYLANVDEAQGDLFDAKSDPKRGRTSPKDDPQAGGGTTVGGDKGPKGTVKTTSDRVDGTKPDARRGDVGKGGQDASLSKTPIRSLLVEQTRLKTNIKAREERLNDPKKMKAYAKGRGTVEELTKLAKDNNANNKKRLQKLNKYLNSKECKARRKEADDRSKTSRIKFKDTSPELNPKTLLPISSVVPQATSGLKFIPEKDVPADAEIDPETGLPIVDVAKVEADKKKKEVKKKETAKPVKKKPDEETLSATEVNEKLRDTFYKNVEDGAYGYNEDLLKYVNDNHEMVPFEKDLPTADKIKILELIASRPKKTRKIDITEQVGIDDRQTVIRQGQEKTLSYFVAQTLGKLPNIETSLDAAAWEAVHGPNSYKKTEKGEPVLSPEEAAYFATDGNQGKLAGRRVQEWVNRNLSPEGRKWFSDRMDTHYFEESMFNTDQRNADALNEQKRKDDEALKDQVNTDLKKDQKDKTIWGTEMAKEIALLDEEGLYVDDTRGVLDQFVNNSHATLALPIDSFGNLDVPLHPLIVGMLRKNNLKRALKTLSTATNNPRIAAIARKIADKVGDTKIKLVKNLKRVGVNVRGEFDPATNTIRLNSDEVLTAHTILHEMTHALTSATLANKSHPVTKQLTTLFNNVKGRLGTAYGTQSLDEFVAETFSNPEFQKELARLNINGEPISAFQRFTNTISNFIRRLIGLNPKPLDALSVTSDLIEGILAPAPKYRDAGKLYLGASGIRNLAREWFDKSHKNKNPLSPTQKENFVSAAIEFISSGRIVSAAKDFFLGFSDSLVIGDIADAVGFKGLGDKLNKTIQYIRGDLEDAGRRFDAVFDKMRPWIKANPELKAKLDEVIYSEEFGATLYQVDPDITQTEAEKRYGKDSERMNIWKKQRPNWNAIGAGGRNVYREMRNYYKKEYAKLRDTLYGQIDESMDAESAADFKKNVFSKIFDDTTLDVYFPLTREGDYKVIYDLKESAIRGTNRPPTVVVTVNTRQTAENLAAELEGSPEVVENSVRRTTTKELDTSFKTAPPTSFVAKIMDTIDAKVKDSAARTMLKDDVTRLFINTLPESSFAKSLVKRKGTPGFIGDSEKAFKEKGFSLGRQTALLQRSKEVRDIMRQVNEIKAEATQASKFEKGTSGWKKWMDRFGVGTPSVIRVANELEKRAKFATQGPDFKTIEKVAKNLNQGAFVYTIGFNASSAIVNLSQIPLFVYPYVGAEYGMVNAYNAIQKASKLVMNSGARNNLLANYDISENRVYTVKDKLGKRTLQAGEKKTLEAFKPLIQEADSRGQLTQSWLLDALGIGETGRANKNLGDTVAGFSAWGFNQAERYNRQTTLLATYELALRKAVDPNGRVKNFADVADAASSEQVSAAVDKALRQTQETNGGSVLETAPRIAQQHVGRVAMMYKSYGIRMYTTMIRSAKKLIWDQNISKEEKQIALKQLIGVHLSALAFAGIQGVPLYGLINMVWDFFLDDEQDDADTIVRKFVNEEWYKGGVNALFGIDVATRVRLTGLLIQENRYNKDATTEENLMFYLGGPAWSTYKRGERAFSDLTSGHPNGFERGVENALPPAFANAWKSGPWGRLAREGYATRRGDTIYGDPTIPDRVLQSIGFPPVEYSFRMEANNIKKGIDTAISKKKSALTKNLYISMRYGDLDGVDEALQKIFAHNDRHPEAPISADSIRKSMTRHTQTTKDIAKNKGVTLANEMLMAINEAEYDDDYRFFS